MTGSVYLRYRWKLVKYKMSFTKFRFLFYITYSCLFLNLVNANIQTSSKNTFAEQLTEENWDRILIGEWMVEL